MNSVGIPGDFRATPDFRENWGFGVVSGDLGGQKAFAQIVLNLLEGPTCKNPDTLAFLTLALRHAPGSRIPLHTNV